MTALFHIRITRWTLRILTYAGLLLVAAAGCNDSHLAPEPAPQAGGIGAVTGTSRIEEYGEQAAPEGVPPEYQFPTMLDAVEATAFWTTNDGGRADAQGIVRYYGTNALIRARVNTDLGADEVQTLASDLLPAWRSASAGAYYPMPTCQGTIRANAYGEVWNEFPLGGKFLSWGRKGGSDQSARDCSTAIVGGGGGGEEGTTTCYTVRTDYYEYDWTTDQLTYLGSDSWSFCIHDGNMT